MAKDIKCTINIPIALAILVGLVLCGAVGVTSLVFSINSNNAVCNCDGIIKIVDTQNGSTSTINNKLSFEGVSGIKTSLGFIPSPKVVIDNLRDLTPYVVGLDGSYEYNSPQDAYNQAIADGKGDSNPAIILIGPGTYPFGSTQFQITTGGIVWSSMPVLSGGGVTFTTTSTEGGIHVDAPFDIGTGVIFQGITFGARGDLNGFLLNHTSGQLSLYMCTTMDSNFRIITGSNNGNFTIFATWQSNFFPLPPSDFITTISSSAVVILQTTFITQIPLGTPTSNGGYILNFINGIGEARILGCFMVFDKYNAVIRGPSSNITSGENSIQVIGTTIIVNDNGNPLAGFIRLSGPIGMTVTSSQMTLIGPYIYQEEDSQTNQNHNIHTFGTNIQSRLETIKTDIAVSIIGNSIYNFYGGTLKVDNNPYIINVPGATSPDVLNITLAGMTIWTQAPANTDYAVGPNSALANIHVGTSNSVSGANTVNNFNYIPLTNI